MGKIHCQFFHYSLTYTNVLFVKDSNVVTQSTIDQMQTPRIKSSLRSQLPTEDQATYKCSCEIYF